METFVSVALSMARPAPGLGVIPVMVGPLSALVAALPAIGLALLALIVTLFKPSTIKRLSMLLWQQKMAVIVIIVAFCGIYYGYSKLFAASFTNSKAVIGTADWIMFRGSPERRGFAPGTPVKGKFVEDAAHGQVNWSFNDGKITTFYSSPAVVGNRVYITGVYYTKYGSFGTDKGGIYCLDADTGKLVWAYHGDGYRSTFSSPAIWGKYLVVGEGLHETKDSRIFCLDIEQSEKQHAGVKLWDYRTTSHMESSPCIDKVNKNVIVGGADDGVYCFALDGDGKGHARKVWQLPGKDYPDCECSPAIYDGKLYFGLGRDIHAMCCAELKTGKPIWRVSAPFPTASPAIADGKLYFGMGIGDFVNDAAGLRAMKEKELQDANKSKADIDAALSELPDAGQVWCIDLATHKVDWKFNCGETVLGTPAIDGDRVYFGAHNGYLYCLSTAGPEKLTRKFNAHGPIVSGPAVGNKYVYVTTTAGMLYALDKDTLAMVWSVGLNNGSFSSPASADGHVYVGTNGAGFLSIGQPGREKVAPLWAGAMGGPGRPGVVDGSRIAGLGGVFAWGYAQGDVDDAGSPTFAVKSPAAIIDSTFYVGVAQKDVNGLAALVCGTGPGAAATDDEDEAARIVQVLAAKPHPAWLAHAKNPVTLSPAATEDYVFFVDGKSGDAGRLLHCIARLSGKELWTSPIASDATGEFSINREMLFIADSARGVSGFKIGASRDLLWNVDVGGCVGTPGANGDLVAIAAKEPAMAMVLDSGTGLPLSQTKLIASPTTGAVIFRDRVWLGVGNGVSAFNLLAGQDTLQAIDAGPAKGRLVCDIDHIAYMNQAGELILADLEAQSVQRSIIRIKGALPNVPPILVDDAMLYCTKNAIERYDLRSQKSSLWASVTPDFPGALVTPMVMMNSHIFCGTEIEGFVCFRPKKDQ